MASSLVDLVVERAAKLAAVSMAAVLLRSHRGASGDGPVCVTVDGSTFHRLRSFRERITGWVDHILDHRVRYRVVSVADASLIGAAVAGVSN